MVARCTGAEVFQEGYGGEDGIIKTGLPGYLG